MAVFRLGWGAGTKQVLAPMDGERDAVLAEDGYGR